MAKKKTIIEETIADSLSGQASASESELQDITKALSKVYRLNNGKRFFCYQTIEMVDEVAIQERYPAGGSFLVIDFNELGQPIDNVTLDIEPKPVAGGALPNGDTHSFQMQFLMNEISWMRQTMANMIESRRSEQPSMSEMVQTLQGLNGLAGGKDPMELFEKGMTFASKFIKGGGEALDWKSELLGIARENLGPAIQAFSMIQRNQPSNGNGEQPIMRIAPSPEEQLKQGIDWVKTKILAGLPADLALEWLASNGNDPQFKPIVTKAIEGGLDAFVAVDPELANDPYKTWLTTVIEGLKDIYAEQSSNATDNDGRTGNGANAKSNAKPRVAKSQKSEAM